MPSSPTARRARPDAPGFTLVELLVALVISGVVATSILQLVRAESRFVATQGARSEVLQNARGTLETLGSELRAISGAGLLEARDTAIRFLYPRVYGVLCADAAAGAAELTLTVPWLGSDAAYGVQAGGALASNTGIAVRTRAEGWRTARASEAVLAAPGASCVEAGASGAELRQLRVRGLVLPAAAERGDLAYLYEELKYDLGISSGIPGVWVRRSSGLAGGVLSQQPLAGPVVKRGGLTFRYQLRSGVAKGSLTAAELAEAAAIVVRVTPESHPRSVGVRTSRSDSIFVRLRNREFP
jgi:prepilin-type N-terminal cleavage/methylation domain-containing protein